MRVYLVDGTFEIFRCFHGAPRARAGGREVGAVRGLLQTLAALLRTEGLTHVAVAFDSVVANTRGLDPNSNDALLRSQYPLAADAVRALGIALWPMSRFQADDALATGAARYKQASGVEQVVICSNDKDFAQCVEGERVVLRDRIRKLTTDEAGVLERFGVPPRSIPAYFALVGDPSDGLPGIPGWGARSAAAVLSRYPDIEQIPPQADAWEVSVRGAARLAANLRERYREALLYRNLSILRTDVPLVDELEHVAWRGARRPALEALTALIQDDSVLAGIPRWAP